ncbi:tyrosine-protein kinase abl-1-like isoform X2 [Mizuhopecten yessoensis]|uniref:tyrosine-protein kinase abl-1-like isoform X2 n=1 Tax=Mizuhopecten yessoensis TaxID=6573 RepID=UPI000B45B59E|nr:tyrosine-protein kinase abl-1-like isoform X2 [Mizuhopecten yessoensis]
MLEIAVILGAGFALCSITLLFGCLCHLFKRSAPFSSFENDEEAGHDYSMSPTNESVNSSIVSNVTFEPLPDILAKTVAATALRPRITSVDKEWQKEAARQLTVYKPFQRIQLTFIKELGLGWFGQVLVGDAERILAGSKRSRVIVKLLKDDAAASDRQLFLEEMVPFRELDHNNVVSLLGQCTETYPFIVILEHAPHGDLKSYLKRHRHEEDDLVKRGVLLQFMVDMAAGLSCLHQYGYIHHDFSCRNCLVMANLKVKVGDYGISEDQHREDYYDTGRDLLPVRWMAPETLTLNQNIWQVSEFTKLANIWSYGVAIWEVIQMAKLPYSSLKDEEVLQQVVIDGILKLTTTSSQGQTKQRLNEVMQFCWIVPEERPTMEEVSALMSQILLDREKELHAEFESKWECASPNDAGAAVSNESVESNQVSAKAKDRDDNLEQDNSFVNIENTADNDSFKMQKTLGTDLNFTENEPSIIIADEDVNGDQSVKVATSDPQSFQTEEYADKVIVTMIEKGSAASGSSLQLTSTPVSRNVSSEYVTAASINQGSEFFSADVSLENIRPGDLPGLVTPTKGKVNMFQPSRQETMMNAEITDDEEDTTSCTSANSVEFVELNGSDDEKQDRAGAVDGSEADKLRMLKESIEDAFSMKSSITSEHSESAKDGGDGSPRDEYDIAREIYISKGTTIPPTEHTSSRNLTTIPEDAIPMDSPSNSGLKFVDTGDESFFSNGVQDTFEWDDYIGDELQLVGKVKDAADSPRQTMEFTDWTLEQDSSQESQHSKADGDKKTGNSSSSSSVSTPYSSSDSEDSDSDDKDKVEKELEVTVKAEGDTTVEVSSSADTATQQ